MHHNLPVAKSHVDESLDDDGKLPTVNLFTLEKNSIIID